MKEASLYHNLPDSNTVQCDLCHHRCKIADKKTGRCGVRLNRIGTLFSLVYGKIVSENIDPIEKKPLFHLKPGSLSYSIATVGCNFRCRHCQNFEISQYPLLHPGSIPGRDRTPADIVESARASNCASISYTYIEPTVFYEFAFETAQLARHNGILNVFVSNGYTSRAATKQLAPVLDGNNIDLKAFTDRFYHEVCGARLKPVLDTITLMKELGVWVEITTLLIPGWNDSTEELTQIADFIVRLDPDIPWHVTRFHPTFQMTDRPATPVETIRRARDIGLDRGLRYVYTGNLPGEQGESTFCPECSTLLIERHGFFSIADRRKNKCCPGCGVALPGIW